jgi:hypothetical protein
MITRIIYSADEGKIEVAVTEEREYCAETSDELFFILQNLNIDKKRTGFAISSSIDFADECGFKNGSEAHKIIDDAMSKYRDLVVVRGDMPSYRDFAPLLQQKHL